MFSVEHPKLLRRCGLSTIRSRSPVSILNVSEIYRAISNDCISAMRAGFIRLLVDQPRSIPFAANLVLTLPVSCYSCHSLPPPPARPPRRASRLRKHPSVCYILVDVARSLAELYDARREKPSVLVTSPGSPDLHAQGRGRHSRHPTGNANVGGSIQVKLGFDPVAFQLIVTIVCAAGLTPKNNGQPRNPYAKIYLLPDRR